MQWVSRIFMICGLLSGAADALYQGQSITAVRVPDGKLVIDGKPDSIWKEIGGRGYFSQIRFDDYGKIVLLESDAIRNAPPQDHFKAPSTGSVTMMAAFDRTYLYFFFIVEENNTFNSARACALPDLWRAHAVDVFVDPAAWSTSLYAAYFSADAGEASYGTSTKTFQVAKPAYPGETREYYRDRTVDNRFKGRTTVSGLDGVSAMRVSGDSNTVGVELKVPIPVPEDYAAGKSMFISWGYNHYPDGSRTSCSENPIAYRWAKHYKTYSGNDQKPPGWRAGDSTHYDPLRSRDGWGRFDLSPYLTVYGDGCHSGLADTTWDLASWYQACGNVPVSIVPAVRNRPSARFLPLVPRTEPGRDIRGRLAPGATFPFRLSPAIIFPARKDGMGHPRTD